jgi:hypothetical protein
MGGQKLKPGYVLDPFSPLRCFDYEFDCEDEPDEILSFLFGKAKEIGELGEYELATDLPQYAYEINTGSYSWYINALKAYRVKLTKAYKSKDCKSPFSSFKEWCEKALRSTVSAINTNIRAAWAISFLIREGFERLPKSPSVAHELSKLDRKFYHLEDGEIVCQLVDIWCAICHKYQDHEITLEKVKTMIGDPMETKPEMKQMRIPVSKYELLFKQAADAGMTPNALLNSILENYLGDKTDDRAAICPESQKTSSEEWLVSEPAERSEISPSSVPDQGSRTIQHHSSDECQSPPTERDLPPNLEAVGSQEPVTDFKAIALEERIANIVKRDIKTSFHKPEKRNFLKDAPWGKLASETGHEPSEVFELFKNHLINVATAKQKPDPKAWAAAVANSLFANEGSELNCVPWIEFSESYKSGSPIEPPQRAFIPAQIEPMPVVSKETREALRRARCH